jgi:PadR family transcriptional regulator, regulatory protein PadR
VTTKSPARENEPVARPGEATARHPATSAAAPDAGENFASIRLDLSLPIYDKGMRKTHSLIQVAMALMADPGGRHRGYNLSKRSGVRSGVLYPTLQRMLDEGWARYGWEEQDGVRAKRPPRRYYELTDKGKAELGALLNEARRDARFHSLVRQFA